METAQPHGGHPYPWAGAGAARPDERFAGFPDYRLGSVVLAATPGHQGIYDVLVGLHVVCALVGFGSVAISGVYGGAARRSGDQGPSEETARYFRSRGWSELLILAVPAFGATAIGFRPAGADFGDLWVIGGLVVWAAASVLLVWVVRPAENRIRAGGADLRASGWRLMWAAGAADILFVVAVALMITQPA
jgi:Predicted integral membrane protein (DUF2269)